MNSFHSNHESSLFITAEDVTLFFRIMAGTVKDLDCIG